MADINVHIEPQTTEITVNMVNGLPSDKFTLVGAETIVWVSHKAHLPLPINGVITLLANYTYFFTSTVDLEGNRLVCGENTTIIGTSSENARVKSTGLTNQALITSYYSLPIRHITFEANIVLDLNGAGANNELSYTTKAIDWYAVNFTDCQTIGTVKNYNNFIVSGCAFINSQGLFFDGNISTIGFEQTLFDCRTNGTIISILQTAIINRRFRIAYCAFVILAGETGINFSTLANVPVESYILDTVNFSGGGTYLAGVQYNDNKALFTSSKGINNSATFANYYMTNNVLSTAIEIQNTFYKILGTTSAGNIVEKFELANNKGTYIGALSSYFKVTATVSCNAGTAQLILIRVAKNGVTIPSSESQATMSGNGRSENIVCQAVVQLNTNDYIEIFCTNSSNNTSVLVTELNTIIEKLN